MASAFMLPSVPAYASMFAPQWDKNLSNFKPLVELKFNRNGIAVVDNIKIEVKHVNGPAFKQTVGYRFFANGKLVCELNQDAKYSYLGPVWTADLKRNGLTDFIVYANNSNDGTSPCSGVILFHVMSGVFKRLDFKTYRLCPKNFVDLLGDGKCEVILRSLYGQQIINKRTSGFLVSTAYRIEDCSLSRMEFGEAGFPRYVWFPGGRSSKQTMKLSDRQKRGIYDSRPSYIKSEYL
jgi:hypothetical protein